MNLKTGVKRIFQGAFEHLWSAGFRGLGRLLRPCPEVWSSPAGRRVLIVAPHPDDEVAGCAGAILAHRQHGDRVIVAVATDGRRSRALGLDAVQMAAARQAEMAAAAGHLDVELEWFGLPEGDWRIRVLEDQLVDLLSRFRPDAVYAPSRIDFHPEHERVARALGNALATADDGLPEIRIYAVQVPLTWRLANLVVPVDPTAPTLEAAVRAHRSQLGSLERCLRRRRYAGGLYRMDGAAETFWRMTTAQYRWLHSRPPSRPLHRTFRGLRYYAWSDPLAYLRGLAERRRLLRSVSRRAGGAQAKPECAGGAQAKPECARGARTKPWRQGRAHGMSDDWRLRPFQTGDEPGICRLLERGFGRPVEEAAWHRKLKRQPSLVENVWLAVDRQDRPIFHYGGIPRTLELAGEQRNVMVAADSVTDPAFRRRGILTAAVSAAHEAWAGAGVACVLGLPNEQWGSRVQALDWRPLFPLAWLIRPLRPERLLARRLRLPGLERLTVIASLWRSLPGRRPDPTLEIRRTEEAAEETGILAAKCASEGVLMLARDREWLGWRYPRDRYRMISAWRAGRFAGYLVYRFDPEGGFGFIAELLTRPADAAGQRALVDSAAARLDDLGAVAVAALAIPGSPLSRAFRRARFFPRRKSFPVHCVPLADDLAMETLRDPGRWWLQGGDFDVT